MKILNLYAGIGGNRRLWGDGFDITAVENDKETAKVYADYFPHDELIIGDAHKYLLENYENYDFIWSSPPCPSHSRLNSTRKGLGYKIDYPDMALYQEIIFLKSWFKGLFVVENVIPYYTPLIPGKIIDRHLFWSNFNIKPFIKTRPFAMDTAKVKDYEDFLGYDLKRYNLKNKIKNLRNCVNPKTGLHILNCAMGIVESKNNLQTSLF